MASFQDSPDEVILKVVNYLDINELVKFGEVSKRMRAISNDKSLWRKMNLSRYRPSWCEEFDVPTKFVKMVIENGCQYLSLYNVKLGTPRETSQEPVSMKSEEHLVLEKASSLRYLDLKYCNAGVLFFEEILASCHLLQRLSMASYGPGNYITPEIIRSICYQNGRTLQTLDLSFWSGLNLESIQKITKNCVGLKNVDLSATGLSKDSILCLVNNITPGVEKLALVDLQNLKDEHVKALVARCNKLSVLNLERTPISNGSLTYIIKNLQHTLEKLNVRYCYGITYDVLLYNITELKSMPKLRCLNYGRLGNFPYRERENLKKILPLVRFGESICVDERELLSADGIWDVEAKQLEYFKKFGESPFKVLPNEIILHLIDPLEMKDLLNFGLVSKRMNALTKEIQRRR